MKLVVRPTEKHWESVLLPFTQQKKSITATAGLWTAGRLLCSRLIGIIITLPPLPVKAPPLRCGLLSEFFDHLLSIITVIPEYLNHNNKTESQILGYIPMYITQVIMYSVAPGTDSHDINAMYKQRCRDRGSNCMTSFPATESNWCNAGVIPASNEDERWTGQWPCVRVWSIHSVVGRTDTIPNITTPDHRRCSRLSTPTHVVVDGWEAGPMVVLMTNPPKNFNDYIPQKK